MSERNSHDPLSVLHGDDRPVQPDPAFAARLRARLESALALPNRTEGVTMSGTDTAIAELNETSTPALATAPPRSAVIAYLSVSPAREAIDWYVDAFGAVLASEPILMDDGRVGHAELSIAGGVLYLADEFPEMGLKGPAAQSVSVSLMLHVADTDAALERARDKGATVQRESYEGHGSRTATIIDPFGHRWMLSGPVAGTVARIQHGDIGYVSVWTADADRAATFYGRVLGWTYDPATHMVTNTRQRIGIYDGVGTTTLFCCYAVGSIDDAGQAIVDAGGDLGEVHHFDFGTLRDATDTMGTPFAVYEPAGSQARPDLNSARHGELSYVTHRLLGDSTAFRDFYGRVLGWTFEPGRIDDGWEPRAVHPMSGIAGGQATTVTVPMWTVADIDAAVARVREAGGAVVEEPSRQSYGTSALCADDQDGPFYLCQY